MKAKEMARLYREAPESSLDPAAKTKDNVIDSLVRQELVEMKKVILARGHRSTKSTMREFELKWESFVREAGDKRLNRHGFRDVICRLVPEAKEMFL